MRIGSDDIRFSIGSPGTTRSSGQMQERHETLVRALAAVTSVYGTDLVLTVGDAPMIRVDGSICPVQGLPEVSSELMDTYLGNLLSQEQRHELESERDSD